MKFKRFLCVYLPNWAIDVTKNLLSKKAEHLTNRPIILTTTIAQQSIVKRYCEIARNAGVRHGAPINLAQALTHNPLILPFKPLQDYRALFRIALRALSLSPLVALDNDLRRAFSDGSLNDLSPEHSGFMLDISGTERIHRGEDLLAQRIFKALEARGISSRIAIAPNIGCAWAHSRFGNQRLIIIPNNSVKESLAALPIASLRVDDSVCSALAELGVYTVSGLLHLPLKEVGLRFGVPTLRRIHQALGTVDEHFEAITPEPKYIQKRLFEVPIEILAAAQQITIQLLRELLIELNLYGLKAGSFVVTFTTRTIRGETNTHHKEISLQSASNETASILQIVGPVIESFKITGAISMVQICAQAVTRQINEQRQIFESPYERELQRNTEEFLNNLTARLGVDEIRQISMYDSHIPEKSYSYITAKIIKENKHNLNISNAIPPRPPTILTKAEKISAVALLPDRPPARIEWRGVTYKIISGKGPERIAPEWWRKALSTKDVTNNATRDYFTLQDHTGRWLWVYRNLPQLDWWIHGIF